MQSSPQRKTEIRRSLNLLTQVTQGDKLQDNASMIEAQRQFQTLRDELSKADQAALMLLASLGERLAGQMFKGQDLPGESIGKLVTEIAEHLVKELAFRDEPKATLAKTSLKLSLGEARLSLRDGQRLGELLVNMTMLTPEQVEEAVRVQRATGQRLGEALLQMRLLTPDMLESALRVQKTKRGAAAAQKSDVWSAHKKA